MMKPFDKRTNKQSSRHQNGWHLLNTRTIAAHKLPLLPLLAFVLGGLHELLNVNDLVKVFRVALRLIDISVDV